jgi:gluconokinase
VAESDTVSPSRAERPLVLALDIGSSSIRAAVHDRLGRTVGGTAIQVRYTWQTDADGRVRLPYATFVGLLEVALDGIETQAAALLGDVVAGGVASIIHSIVGLDERDRPVTPVLSWADTSSAAEATALRARVDAEAMRATTGAPIHAGYWPARIERLRQEQPNVQRWAGVAELLLEHLTGRFAVSRSMASGTGLLDRARGTWATTVLEPLRIDLEQLPAISPDNEPVGKLSSHAARRWPGLARFEWFAAWGDGACGNVGLGAMGPGTAALMVGTSGALRSIVPEPAPPLPAGLFAQRLGEGTVIGGQLSEGGGTLAWASRLLGQSQRALERAAAALEPDAHGLTILPYTFGERGLGYHDDARGVVAGLGPSSDAAQVYRAILESIAAGFAAVDETLRSALGGAPQIVAAGGAIASSPLLASVIADSLGRDISVAPAIESSRRGAALLALWGSGHLADPADAPAPTTTTVSCDPARAARYRAATSRRAALYRTLLS